MFYSLVTVGDLYKVIIFLSSETINILLFIDVIFYDDNLQYIIIYKYNIPLIYFISIWFSS